MPPVLLKAQEGRKGDMNKHRHINGMGKEYDGNDIYIVSFPSCIVGRDSVVGIATGYRLDGLGIESRWGVKPGIILVRCTVEIICSSFK